MPWQEVLPGRYERSLDPSEAFFNYLKALPHPPGRERWALTSVTRFKSDLQADSILHFLRQAWKQLRYQFPVLAARLEDTKKTYEVPTVESLEAWLDATIVVEPTEADPGELIAAYNATELSKLHYLPGSSQILIHVNHWRTDAIGLCILTNRFFDLLVNPQIVIFGDEGRRLSPSIEEAAGVCEVTEERLKMIQDKHEQSLLTGQSVAVPSKGIGKPEGTYRKIHTFSENTTSAIIAACKALRVTITTAVTAALIITARKFEKWEKPEHRAQKMTLNPYFNLRPYMPPPFVGAEHPLSMMVTSDTIHVDLLEFEESIKQIAPFYARDLGLHSGTDLIPLVGAKNQAFINALNAPPSNPTNGPAGTSATRKLGITPSLNSIGILDQHIHTQHRGKYVVEITDYWFAVEILGPVLMCYLWTFQGRMHLTAYFNGSFFSGEFVKKFTDSLAETLLHELKIEE